MKIMKSEKGFLALPQEQAFSYKEAAAVIIPFGLEASVSYGGGTKKGPQAMIKASHEVELFDEQLWCEPFEKMGVVTLKEPEIKDNIAKALVQLEKIVQKVLDDYKFPFVFGGEHSITAGSIRPFARKYDDLVILHFDAHADLRDGYEGEHYSHASALRRCLDDDAVEARGENIKLVSCGIRNISAGEIPFLEENKHRIKIFWAKDKKNWNIKEIVAPLKGKSVYLTFDVDGLDSSIMPATGTPEPGGMLWNDVIEIITEAAKVSNIVGADINELAPIEGWHACDFLAAKLAYKILSLVFCKDKL
jgi:agmatinase